MKKGLLKLLILTKLLCVVFVYSYAQTTPLIDSLSKQFYEKLNEDHIKEALMLNEQVSALFLEIGDTEEWVRFQTHKAEILRGSAELDEAFATINNAEAANKELDYSTVKSVFYNRKAAILFELQAHQEALIAVKESQRIDSIKNYKWRILSNYILEGAIYRETNSIDKAIRILKKTLFVAKEQKNVQEYKLALYNIANCFSQINEYPKALIFCKKFNEIDSVFISINHQGDIAHIQYNAYKTLGITDSALFALEQAYSHRLHKMELLTEENAKANEQAIELAQEKIENYRLETKNERNNLRFIILILAFTIAGAVAFWFYKRRNFYKSLNKKQEELNTQLKATGSFNAKLMGILAHDIRNPMIGITGMLELYMNDELAEKDLKQHIKSLYSNTQNVNFLIENILNWIKSQGDNLSVEITEFNLSQLIDKIEGELSISLDKKKITLSKDSINDALVIKSDINILHLALRNVITNAVKFSKLGDCISLSHERNGNYECVIIKDQGRGISEQMLKQIGLQKATSKDGTQHEKGTGLGLPLTFEMIEALNGKVEITSVVNEGTTVTICLPA